MVFTHLQDGGTSFVHGPSSKAPTEICSLADSPLEQPQKVRSSDPPHLASRLMTSAALEGCQKMTGSQPSVSNSVGLASSLEDCSKDSHGMLLLLVWETDAENQWTKEQTGKPPGGQVQVQLSR